MLDSIITSKTRIKLLLKFFLNASTTSYLRGLAEEFNESTNAIRVELNRMEEAGLLSSKNDGNRKFYKANAKHPLFNEIHYLVLKHSGITQIIDEVISRIGDIHKAWVTGTFAEGIDSDEIGLIVMGENIDQEYLNNLIKKAQKIISRRINVQTITPSEEKGIKNTEFKSLLIWEN